MKKIALIITAICFTSIASAADLVGIITDESPGATNGAIDLSVSGGVAPYQISWTGPSGFTSTSEDISGLAAGDYTVVVTDSYCGEASYTFTVDLVNNASLVEKEVFALSVYPNPTNGLLYFDSNEVLTIEVYNVSGELILKKENAESIDLETYSSGNYLLKVISNKGIVYRKAVKH